MNLLKLKEEQNHHYKYALKQEISRATSGNAAPHSYPGSIDLHPLINRYRNKNFFDINSDSEGWYKFLIKVIKKPAKVGLSLGSGDARHEKKLTELGLVESWYGVDLAENPLDTFTGSGENKFLYGDLNFMELPKNEFDIIYCHAFIHHITNLEHLFYQIYNSLTDEGVLVIYEYVGENKWQWDENKLNLLTKEAEEKLGKDIPGIKFGRKPLHFMSERPFESIRSSEIPKLILNYFSPVYHNHWNKVIYPFINGMMIPRKYANDESKIQLIIEHIVALENELKDDKELLPTELNGVYRKQSNPDILTTDPWSEKEIEGNLGKIEGPVLYRIKNSLKSMAKAILKR